MATQSASDPFYAVRDALRGEVQGLQAKFEQWRSLLGSVNTASDTGFRVRHEELKRDLAKAADMCSKIRLTVANVERSRAKFPHIDDRELALRKEAVELLERSIGGMREAMASTDTTAKLQADQRRELHSRAAAEREDAARKGNAYTASNSEFLRDQQAQQQVVRQAQDQTLDRMGNSLDTLGEMARGIQTELQEQDKILEDVDRGVDEAQNKMDKAIAGIEKLLKTKDRCQLATIFILVGIFIAVAIVAFYKLTG